MRRRNHAAMLTNLKSRVGCPLIRSEWHDAGLAVIPHIDLPYDHGGVVLHPKRQAIIAHRARGGLDGLIEAADDVIHLALSLLVAIRRQTLIMVHIGQRLRAREFEEGALLAEVELALLVAIVAALGTARGHARLVQVLGPPHMATDATNAPRLDQRLLWVANGELLDLEATAVGIEGVARG
jgi:hypothetical protein